MFDNTVFRFTLCRSVSEIFAIRVKSCPKACGIFQVFFALPNFVRNPSQKLYPRYHGCLLARRLVKFREATPTSPKVIGINTLVPIGVDLWSITQFTDFRYVDPFQRYFAMKLESCQKSLQICDFFAPPKFVGGTLSKNCVHVISPALSHIPW